jgi:uncharacterized membrane protein YdfJ with MMPL/SSD domain
MTLLHRSSAEQQPTADQPPADRRSFTERVARAAAGRPWLTVALWGLVLAGAVVLMVAFMGGLSASDSFVNNPESIQAADLIAERLPGAEADTEIVVIRRYHRGRCRLQGDRPRSAAGHRGLGSQ